MTGDKQIDVAFSRDDAQRLVQVYAAALADLGMAGDVAAYAACIAGDWLIYVGPRSTPKRSARGSARSRSSKVTITQLARS